MIESDEWDVIGNIGRKTPAPGAGTNQALDELAERHREVSVKIGELQDILTGIEGEIAHMFPEVSGEQSITTDRFEVVVSRSERWSWDKDALEEMFGQGDLPDYVKRSMSVDKRKFLKLPTSEQESLHHALTRNLDKPKIKVNDCV